MFEDSSSRLLKLCFVLGAMNSGGVQTFLLRLIGFLNKKGHKVKVLTTRGKGVWWDKLPENGAMRRHIPWKKSLCPYTHSIRIGNWLQKNSFDVIVLNHSREAQLSLDMLGDYQKAVPILHNDSDGALYVACLNQNAWNVLVCVSPKLASTAQAHVPSRPVEHIDYAVNIPDRQLFTSRRSWNEQLSILYTGRIVDEQKGVLKLPEILAACRRRGVSCRLTIIGDGPDRSALHKTFFEAGLDSNVNYLGTLDPQDVVSHMLDHHVLLMPSRYEGLGIVALEAQACGCVPVASRLSGVTDHSIVDGKTGFLAPFEDTEAFAGYIELFAKNEELWRRFSLSGRVHITEYFTVQKMGESYERLFKRLISGKFPLPKNKRKRIYIRPKNTTWRDLVPNIFRRYKYWLSRKKLSKRL